MNIQNFTPHKVTVFFDGGSVDFASQGVARVSSSKNQTDSINLIPLYKEVLGQVEGLPQQKKDTFLIVSRLIKAALPDRTDLICPDTGDAVRDSDGRIIGVKGFII